MYLAQLSRYIEDNKEFPEEIDVSALNINDWTLIEDTRSQYMIFAVVKDDIAEYMESLNDTFKPLIDSAIDVYEMKQTLDIDKIGEIGYGEVEEDDLNFIKNLNVSAYTVLDFNSRDCYAFLLSIMKLEEMRVEKIEIKR